MAKIARVLIIVVVAALMAFVVVKVIGRWQDSQSGHVEWSGQDSHFHSETTRPGSSK